MLDGPQEGTCPLVKLVSNGPRYTAEGIRQALPRKSKATRRNWLDEGVNASRANDATSVAIRLKHQDLIKRVISDFSTHEGALWQGNWRAVKDAFSGERQYPSQSEADHCLTRKLARRFAADGVSEDELPVVVEAAFEQSGLANRDKWRQRVDYRHLTILAACSGITTHAAMSTSTNAQVDWSLHGDIRTAKFFADKCRGKFLYVTERKQWLRWEDDRWHWCVKEEQVAAAKEVCVKLVGEAAKCLAEDLDKGRKRVHEASDAHKEQRITAMLKLARSEPGMSVTAAELDNDPYLLGVSNGVVDLRTGTLTDNRPDLKITRYCSVDYLPGAPAPRWTKFLDEVFESDTETIDAVQRLLGLTLTGVTNEELLIFAVGTGANGKSIFSNTVSSILGDYGVAAPSTVVSSRRTDDNGPRNDIAMLAGARLVSINELPGGMRLDETVAKQLAGREPITARFLNREFFTFQPSFTPWVRTNHRPIIKGTDDGIWRRLCIIRFGRSFSPDEADPKLERRLYAERVGVLNWMVEGARKYLQSGIVVSPKMKREQAQYRTASDVLGEFLAEKTEEDAAEEVLQTDLYSRWGTWCGLNGYQTGAKATFTERLRERGYDTRKSGAKRYYTGLKMRSS